MRPEAFRPAALALALLVPACAGNGPPGPAEPTAAGDSTPGRSAPPDGGGSPATAAPAGPEFAAPAALEEGDRWFVALHAESGPEPVAERRRLRRVDGVLREEVTWGRSFADLASAVHGVAQVFAVVLDARGLSCALLDDSGRMLGEPRLEVAAPFRPGNRWRVDLPGGASVSCGIEAIEEVETPSGKVRALRVGFLGAGSAAQAMTIWYDAGLRTVRSEIREAGSRSVVEARAALASPAPGPEECRAALDWARKNLAK